MIVFSGDKVFSGIVQAHGRHGEVVEYMVSIGSFEYECLDDCYEFIKTSPAIFNGYKELYVCVRELGAVDRFRFKCTRKSADVRKEKVNFDDYGVIKSKYEMTEVE